MSKWANEVGLLRRTINNLVLKKFSGVIDEDVLQNLGLARGKITPTGFVGLLHDGVGPFSSLAESMFSQHPNVQRGTTLDSYQIQLLNILISDYLDREAASIDSGDVERIELGLLSWFSIEAGSRTVFIPCVISPSRSSCFSIGPVSFLYREDVQKSKYYPDAKNLGQFTNFEFESLLEMMRSNSASWLAVVDIIGCDNKRSLDIANLAVDISLVALQVAAPYMDTRSMSRLADRRGPSTEMTLMLANGHYSAGRTNKEAGLSIGEGYLAEILKTTAQTVTAVGNCVKSFVTGSFRLSHLEQAWCDAAYWLHQGLAEPLDSIAVTKLETSLEVLLSAGSTKNAKPSIIMAVGAFLGLGSGDTIVKSTGATVKMLARDISRDRSRVLHGDWSTLNVRLASSRKILEEISIIFIRESAVELDLYAREINAEDSAEEFLKWVKARREQSVLNPS